MNAEIKTNVIKRNGEEVAFDLEKIVNAIKGANKDVDKLHRMNEYQIMAVAANVAKKIEESTHAVNVEAIQDMVVRTCQDVFFFRKRLYVHMKRESFISMIPTISHRKSITVT